MEQIRVPFIYGIIRIAMGWVFLWSFIDKLWGLGFATESGKAWVNGVSPTAGFLKFGTTGPYADFFQSLAGSSAIDWLYMLGMLFVGLSLVLGIFTRIAAGVGIVMMTLILLAVLPLTHNPAIDEHVLYIFILFALPFMQASRTIGLGNWWSRVVNGNKLFE